MLKFISRSFVTAFLLVFTSIATAASPQFSNFYFFGDSLTDTGNLGRFVNSGGFMWGELLTQRYGGNSLPSSLGGNNWAVAGATTTDTNTQIANYLARVNGRADSRALYSVWAGPNDFLACAGDPTCAALVPFIGSANIVAGIKALSGAGAKYIVATNMADLSRIPLNAGLTADQRAGLQTAINGFNFLLAQQINASGVNVIQVDINSVLSAVITNPTQFGLNDSTTTCGGTAQQCVNALFLPDGLHPSAAGQELVYYTIASYLDGATYASILAEAPFEVMNTHFTVLGNELADLRIGNRWLKVGHVRPFANVGYATDREFGGPIDLTTGNSDTSGFKGRNTNFTVGADYRFNDRILVGVAMGRSNNELTFGRNGGQVSIAETFFSAFGGYQFDRGYVQGIVSLGMLKYNNFARNVRLRQTVNVFNNTTGDANGTQFGGKLEGGYRLFERAGFQTGPIATVGFQSIQVNAFGEMGAAPGLNLQYASQKNTSLVTGLGWQFSHTARVGSVDIKPYGRFSYNREWLRKDREVGIGAVSIGGKAGFVPVPNVADLNGRSWGLVEVGISGQFNRGVTVGVSYQTTVARKYGQANAVILSVSIPI
jgi:outer membrane lipase/esterase